MPPPLLRRIPTAPGTTRFPAVERYGSIVRVTLGLITLLVAMRLRRCLPARYSTDVNATTSEMGFTVTLIETGDELTPALLVAIAWSCMIFCETPRPSVGVKRSCGPIWVIGLITGMSVTPPFSCDQRIVQVSPFGSRHVALKVTGVPVVTTGLSGELTVMAGAAGGFTLIVTLGREVPTESVTSRFTP